MMNRNLSPWAPLDTMPARVLFDALERAAFEISAASWREGLEAASGRVPRGASHWWLTTHHRLTLEASRRLAMH